MTRKHFKILAETISLITNPVEAWAVATVVIQVGSELNPRFDKARFLAACDVAPEKGAP